MPILYAVGVSLYTVVTFALWADLSTSADITWNVAVGVALSAWSATFLSTALALGWRTAGLDLDAHLWPSRPSGSSSSGSTVCVPWWHRVRR